MPDLAMCQQKECPSSKECYRFMAIPGTYHQVYALFEVPKGKDRCSAFMEIWK